MTSSSAVSNSPQPRPDTPEEVAVYDRAPTDRDLPCPLCEYNLRNATEPRCPECGLRFAWPDLLDPERRRHEYLFEHHPRRNVWSFYRTFVGAMLPRRFWRTLRPGQPSNVRRLICYWLLTMLVALALPVGLMAMEMAELAADNQGVRARYGAAALVAPMKTQLDREFPVPPQPAFFGRYFFGQRHSLAWALYQMELHWTLASVIYLAWPWLTFLALLVFQISMRRARIRAAHVLRCVIYTFGPTALGSWLLLAFTGTLIVAAPMLVGRAASTSYATLELLLQWTGIAGLGPTGFNPMETLLFLTGLIMLVVFTYRLAIAYRLYLQFPHPVTTVVVSQVLAAAAMVTAVFVAANLLFPVRS